MGNTRVDHYLASTWFSLAAATAHASAFKCRTPAVQQHVQKVSLWNSLGPASRCCLTVQLATPFLGAAALDAEMKLLCLPLGPC